MVKKKKSKNIIPDKIEKKSVYEANHINYIAPKLIVIKEDWLPLSLMFLLVIFFLHNGLFPLNGPQVLSYQRTDTATYFFPTLSFASESLLKGEVPLWNPYSYSGIPFIGIIQTAVFYPLNCLYLILPLSSAINWTIFLHLFISGVVIYYLLKNYGICRSGSTVAGIIYTFAAPHIMHIYAGHLVILSTIIWTPLMFLFLDRFVKGGGHKYGFFFSLAIACQLLAGYPQHVFYSMIALSFYLILFLIRSRNNGAGWDKIGLKCIAFASFVILGVLLSAIQLLPTMELTEYSTREALSYEWVSLFSFPPENFITFLIPDFFGDMLKISYWGKCYLWEMTSYAGILPLLLSLISLFYIRNKIVYFFSGLAICSLVLAVGKYTPLLKLLYLCVPGFKLFRGHSKFIFLNTLSLAVLSGFGVDALLKGFKGLKSQYFRTGIIALNLVIVVVIIMLIGKYDGAWFKEAIAEHVYSGEFFLNPNIVMQAGFEASAVEAFQSSAFWFIGMLIFGSALLLLYSYGILETKSLMVSLFVFIIFDLFSFGMRYMVTFDSSKVYWDKEIVSYLEKDKEPFRVIAPEMAPNSGIGSRIETPNGYDAMLIKRYSEYMNFALGTPDPNASNLTVIVTIFNKLIDMLNNKYLVVSPVIKVDNPAFELVLHLDRYNIYKNKNALPRAFVVYNEKVIKDRDAIFREMANPGFNPMQHTILEEELENGHLLFDNSKGRSKELKLVHYSPKKIIMEIDNPQRGLLVLGNVFYPGWRAYLDGKETKIYSANYIMQAIELPAGTHTVMFHYDPLTFRIGTIISVASMIFIILFFSLGFLRRKRGQGNCVKEVMS